MKNFRIYIFALLTVIFGAVSCTDTGKQEELVPEGVLKIFVPITDTKGKDTNKSTISHIS